MNNTPTTATPELPPSVLTKQQYKSMGPRPIKGYGEGAAIWAHYRYDDQCNNGHNTFAITASVRVPRTRDEVAGGCLHEEIAEVFPELAPFIKWHLCSSDGPMHYLANTLHFAGDADCHGHRKGEPSSWEWVIRWNGFPIEWRGGSKFIKWCQEVGQAVVSDCEVIAIEHPKEPDGYKFKPKYTLGGFPCERWHECPFDTEREALQFLAAAKLGFTVDKVPTAWSEGKARELDAARHSAIWPEATDEQLCLPREQLKALLEARLPALMVEFKAAMESLGFVY